MITKNGVADISFEIQTLIVNKIQIKNVHQPPGTTYLLDKLEQLIITY